jgi:hypothetical protein
MRTNFEEIRQQTLSFFSKDNTRYAPKSAQFEIVTSFMPNFQQWKVSMLVVIPAIFSLIGLALPYFDI